MSTQVHVGNAMKFVMAKHRVTLGDLSEALRVSRKTIRNQLKQRDIGILKILEFTAAIGIRLDMFVDITGYYSPGATEDPSAWNDDF